MPNPTLAGAAGSLTFLENTVNAIPQLLDSDVTFNDVDNNFNGGTVTVTGLLAEDRLAIRNQGTAAGQIGVSGSNVTFGGTLIGTFTGGTGSTLTITLNGAANSTAVDALIQNLTYGNVSDTPTASRVLTLNVTDAAGGYVTGIPAYATPSAASDPFDTLMTSSNASPVFIDLDGDGDLDLLSGAYYGNTVAFRNNGDGSFTSFASPIAGGASIGGIGMYSRPFVVDWDNDGDNDLTISGTDSTIAYFRNDGGGNFSQPANPFAAVQPGFSTAHGHFIMDVEGDGDLDAVMIRDDGSFATYKNTAGTFALVTGAQDPFTAITLAIGIQNGFFAHAAVVDFDGDGDKDVIIGTEEGNLIYVRNDGAGNFQLDTSVPFLNQNFAGVGFAQAAPSFVDYDGDGDLDLVMGRQNGSFLTFRNDASPGHKITVNVTAEADNTAPVVDLNGGGAGTGETLNYTENQTAAIAPSATVTDAESPNFDTGQLTVSFTAGGSAEDRLTILNQGAGAGQIGVSGSAVSYQGVQIGTFTGGTNGSTPLVVTLDPDATPAAVQALTRAIAYSNVSEDPSAAARTVQFAVSDGDGGTSVAVTATVNVTAVNDAPVNTVPGTQTINEDGGFTLSTLNGNAISVADVDAPTLSVTLSVAHGALTLGTLTGLSFGVGDGTSDLTMTFSGTAAAINAALGSGLAYSPNPDFNGTDTLSVTTTDSGQTGTGGAGTDSDTVTVNLTAINDAPVVVGSGTESAATIDEDTPGAGQTVHALFAGQYSDAADNQIPNGGASSPGSFGGIAVVDNGSSGATGQWQYFDSNTSLWVDIGARTTATALLINSSTAIRFNPATDFNGTAPTLTAHLIDNSLGFGITFGQAADLTGATGGTTAYSTGTVVLSQTVAAVDDPAVAVDDSGGTVAENATLTFDVRGNDNDLDGPALAVAEINGTAATVGIAIGLASGATVTLEADGRLTYDPNGKFNYLISTVTAGTTLAVNDSASDNFTYKLAGGNTATVTMTVTGVTSAGDQLWGDAGNNIIDGTPAGIVFNLGQGGDDTATGQGGNDGFYMGAELSALDVLDGGGGILDQLGLQGNYGAPFVFGASHLTNIEMLVLLSGSDTRFGDTSGGSYSYNLKTIDANVGAGKQMAVSFNSLLAGENVTFDGSDESDGWFLTFGGLGNDALIGGDQDDRFYFGNNGLWGAGDSVDGGAGILDQLGLQGSYTVTFGAGQLTGIEMLVLLTGGDTRFGNPAGTGYSYNMTMDDGNVGNGQMFYVSANTLRAGVPGVSDETLVFDGSAESDGRFTIYSGDGDDTLTGGDQDDKIYGASGADTMTGGLGNDTFAYMNAAHSTTAAMDQILDFSLGDKIDLSAIDAITGGANDAFSFIASSAFSNIAGQLRAFDTGGGIWQIQGDLDGNGIADLVIAVTTAQPLIASTDFIL